MPAPFKSYAAAARCSEIFTSRQFSPEKAASLVYSDGTKKSPCRVHRLVSHHLFLSFFFLLFCYCFSQEETHIHECDAASAPPSSLQPPYCLSPSQLRRLFYIHQAGFLRRRFVLCYVSPHICFSSFSVRTSQRYGSSLACCLALLYVHYRQREEFLCPSSRGNRKW